MKKALADFRDLKLTKDELKKKIGDDLHNVACPNPLTIRSGHVINAIRAFTEKRIPVERLVDWVNTIWFTDLFQFQETETDSIVSVLEILETWDEEATVISLEECEKMVAALSENSAFTGT